MSFNPVYSYGEGFLERTAMPITNEQFAELCQPVEGEVRRKVLYDERAVIERKEYYIRLGSRAQLVYLSCCVDPAEQMSDGPDVAARILARMSYNGTRLNPNAPTLDEAKAMILLTQKNDNPRFVFKAWQQHRAAGRTFRWSESG